jgi:hypothetical protein
MHRIGELRRVRIIGRQIVIGRRFAVGAPYALDLAAVGVEYGDPVIAVAVGGVDFVRLGIELERSHKAELAQVRARGQRAALAELFDEFAVGGEFQHHAVALAVAAQPDKTFVVDQDGVLLQRPVVAEIISGPAPRLDDVTRLIEHQHRWRRHAAFGARRRQRRALLVVGQRARPLEHPDIVLRIDRHAADLTQDPIVGQRFWPERIDTKHRALRGGRHDRSEQQCERGCKPTNVSHKCPPRRTWRAMLARCSCRQ